MFDMYFDFMMFTILAFEYLGAAWVCVRAY